MRVGARSCPYRLVLVVVVVEDRERRGGVVSPIVSRGAHSGRGVSMGPAGNQTLAPPRTGTRGMRGRPNQSGPPCDVTSCPLVNQDDGNFFLSFFFVISSSCCRRRRLFPSGNKRHFIVAGAPGVGLKKVTRSRWREPKKPLEMKARPSSLSSGVCVRACRFHLLFKYPFSSLLFSKQNIPPNGRRRPSHHPRLYNVIRVYICSIHKHVTCSFFCFPEKEKKRPI